jgi:Ca2+-transporting ATPase
MLLVTVSVSFLTQLTLIYVPFMQAIFQTEGLNSADMRTVGVLAGISFMLHEGRRVWERRRDRWDEIRTGRSSPENGDAMV